MIKDIFKNASTQIGHFGFNTCKKKEKKDDQWVIGGTLS